MKFTFELTEQDYLDFNMGSKKYYIRSHILFRIKNSMSRKI